MLQHKYICHTHTDTCKRVKHHIFTSVSTLQANLEYATISVFNCSKTSVTTHVFLNLSAENTWKIFESSRVSAGSTEKWSDSSFSLSLRCILQKLKKLGETKETTQWVTVGMRNLFCTHGLDTNTLQCLSLLKWKYKTPTGVLQTKWFREALSTVSLVYRSHLKLNLSSWKKEMLNPLVSAEKLYSHSDMQWQELLDEAQVWSVRWSQ